VQRSKRSGEISREIAISTIKERPPILRQQTSQHKPYQGPSSRNEVQRSKRSEEISPRISNQPHQGTASNIAAANIATQALSKPSSRNEVQRSKRSGEISPEIAISLIKELPPILRQQISQHKPCQGRHLATKCSAANEVEISPEN